MIVRVAVVPHPPLLVPELVSGDDPDARRVRDATLAVAAELAAAAPRWFAVGADPTGPRELDGRQAGTFLGYGVDVVVRLSDDITADDTAPDPSMPLPALVAGWLRERTGATDVTVRLVPPNLPPAECRTLGERLTAELANEPVGLLVLGDGSHRHGERAVGRPDPRAAAFDDTVHTALAAADPAALLAIDPRVAHELGAVGRAPWQVLAGLAAADPRGWKSTDTSLLVPYGVAYHLAVWTPAR